MQIVWDTTTKLGVGIAYAHGQTWIVARYAPAENYDFIEPIQDHVHNPKGMLYPKSTLLHTLLHEYKRCTHQREFGSFNAHLSRANK